jgi:glycosyltransferase involved in cell wall biosynthesis
MTPKSKILIAAYACEPGRGSESAVGWNWSLQAARLGHEVHVITRANNRHAIEASRSVPAHYDLCFHYMDYPQGICRLKRALGSYGVIIYYYLWQMLVWRAARKLHRVHHFDLVHHVTFGIDWMPSGLAWLGIPFIWGPVGGSTHTVPPGIASHLPHKALFQERTRRLIQDGIKRWDFALEATRRRALRILTYTQEAVDGIPPRYRNKVQPVVHIGVHASDIPSANTTQRRLFRTADLKVLSNGRFVHWKGHDLLILGFARFLSDTGSNAQLLISGRGPYEQRLKTLVAQLGVGDHIQILDPLPHRDDVYKSMAECDLYALLTCRDGPPVSILEAMHMGRPVMCLDMGATKELVPEGAGIKLTGKEFNGLVAEIAQSLTWALTHKDALRAMGEQGSSYVNSFHSWDRIGEELDALYRQLQRDHRERHHQHAHTR